MGKDLTLALKEQRARQRALETPAVPVAVTALPKRNLRDVVAEFLDGKENKNWCHILTGVTSASQSEKAGSVSSPKHSSPAASWSQFGRTAARSTLLGMAATSVASFAPIRSVTYASFCRPATAPHLHSNTH